MTSATQIRRDIQELERQARRATGDERSNIEGRLYRLRIALDGAQEPHDDQREELERETILRRLPCGHQDAAQECW